MRRFIPDILVYCLVFGVVLVFLFRNAEGYDAPEAPPPSASDRMGAALAPPTSVDSSLLVEVPAATSSSGSAFAISSDGLWLTARHVVDGCDEVGLMIGPGMAAKTSKVIMADYADLAALITEGAPHPLALELKKEYRKGQAVFHVGYPQGRPGEAASRLMGRERLVARGRYQTEEPVLAWAEVGRTRGLSGTLAGLSGGPALDGDGKVVGVTIAEQPRRGRIFTSDPDNLVRFIKEVQAESTIGGESAGKITFDDYGPTADLLRRDMAVAKVVCVKGQANTPAPSPG
ncbi:MAG: serine protease [Caulobacterales bacterium]